ncbi:hypothetical protein ACX0G7_09790 [Flavitalea antarctica]
MKFIPILFSTPMVQAIQAGRKSVTRRIMKPQPELRIFQGAVTGKKVKGWQITGTDKFWPTDDTPNTSFLKCPYGQPGDVLWVRETHYAYGHWSCVTDTETGKEKWSFKDLTGDSLFNYAYENNPPARIIKGRYGFGWYKRPSLFMPKSACRIFLEVTEVRVERLQDISEEDAKAEGAERGILRDGPNTEKGEFHLEYNNMSDHKDGFQFIWQMINGKESWNLNPWVWVVSFKQISKPENFQ